MPHYQIVAVGGTGQMVLHFYAQLFLTGSIEAPFQALVVDTDRLSPSLACLKQLFDEARVAAGPNAALAMPKIEYLPVGRDEQGTVEDLLAGGPLDDSRFAHSLQAFFSASDRKQSVREGLFARPALSAVLALDQLREKLRYLPNGSRVGVVSSMIGGTGAGLTLPILDLLQRQPGTGHELRAVFLSMYFQPDPSVRKDQLDTFRSNQACFELTRKSMLAPLDHFAVIDGPQIHRDKSTESSMRHYSWPETENHPYWKALSALKSVLEENVRDRGLEIPYDFQPLDRNSFRESMQKAVARIHSFCRHRVLNQIAADLFVDHVWGGLAKFLRSYADCMNWERTSFARQLQAEVQSLWSPPATASYGLIHVFPEATRRFRTLPRDIAGCAWKQKPDDVTRDSLGSQVDATRRIAALVLYTLLRER